MNRKYVIASLASSILLIVVLVVLLAMPGARFAVFRVATELPAVATKFAIQKHAKSRDFKSGVAGLERQLSVVQWADTSRSSMLRGVLENTEMFMGVAALASDYAVLVPFLARLVEEEPDLFMARVWIGQALVHINPEEAFPHLEVATRIVPADARPYRIAMGAALSLGDREKAEYWCKRYANAQFGGIRPLIYLNIFGGTGLRKLALEVADASNKLGLITNEGVQTGTEQVYNFDLPERVTPVSLRLHTGILPGVGITFGDIIFYGPNGPRSMSPGEYFVLPGKGFMVSPERMVTISFDGDIITLLPRSGTFGTTDRVDIRMTFERLGLASIPGCETF